MKNIELKSVLSKFSIITALFLSLLFTACNKEKQAETTPAPSPMVPGTTGNLEIYFDNRAGADALVFGTNYINANGDTMNFSMFNYFVSNFSLTKADGSSYTLAKDSCYFLVKHDVDSTRSIVLKNIPVGDYTSINFMIGVDSLKSASDISERTGVLDPAGAASGMYWAWNSGYIFVKAEGTSPQSSNADKKFKYHIGLFGGRTGAGGAATLNNLRTVRLPVPGAAIKIRNSGTTPEAHVKADIMELFKTPTTISINANSTVMANAFSANVADNYVDMFKIDHVHQ
jgi:hypothetical protein